MGTRSAGIGGDNLGIVSTGDSSTNVQVSLPDGALRPVTEVAAPPRLTNVPTHSGEFVGREDELARLDASLHGSSGVVVAAVHGLGGVGKSTLAARYAAACIDRFNPVWWITADTAESVQAGLAALTTRLQPELGVLPSLEDLANRAVTWLAAHNDWIVVLDNVNSPADIAPLLSPGMPGQVVVTSRLAEGWHRLNATLLRLDVLTEQQAIELLKRVATGGRANVDMDGAMELVRELGFLPLAVEQAAAYLHQVHLSPRTYLTMLTEHPAVMYDRAARGSDAERTIARIWRVTLDALADTPLAGQLLRIMAWYAPEAIPRSLFDQADQPPRVQEALGSLAAYNMIALTQDTVTVHRLVQAVARTSDPGDPHRQTTDVIAAHAQAIGLLDQALPNDKNPEGWPLWRSFLPHIDIVTTKTGTEGANPDAARLLNKTGIFLLTQGDVERAIAYLQQAFIECEGAFSANHSNRMASRNNLASAYQSAGDLDRAIPLFKQALADRERVLGTDHPDTLTSRNNLANAYLSAGDLDRAIPLFKQALADRERVLGTDHPKTLTSRNNLANAYQSAGDLDRAILILVQTLTEQERLLGTEHPDTMLCRCNLANAYEAAGNPNRAIPLHQQTLTDRERVLGVDHPDTLTSRNNLASAYQSAGILIRAFPLYKQTLSQAERILGANHPDTLAARNNLAGAYGAAGNLKRAIPLYEQNLNQCTEVLGANHLTTLTTRNNLASAYRAAGDFGRAISLHMQNLASCERILGANHPDTLASRNNLASTYQAAGDLDRAIPLFRQNLLDQERVLGTNNPETLTSRNNLASAYQTAGDLNRAIPLYQQNLPRCEQVLGADHPTTRMVRDVLNQANKRSWP